MTTVTYFEQPTSSSKTFAVGSGALPSVAALRQGIRERRGRLEERGIGNLDTGTVSSETGELKAPLIDEVQFSRGAKLSGPLDTRVADLETWSGRVADIDGEVFMALLTSNGSGAHLTAEFDVAQIGEHEELAVGDLIYVTVRTVLSRTGYPMKTSSVRLRRLGRWTARELETVAQRAQEEKQAWEGLFA